MELASQDLISALLREAVRSSSPRAPRGGAQTDGAQPQRHVSGRRRPRCRCGKCRQCQDDARWERIFAEKFADPEYYTRRHVRCTSPLDSI